MKRRRLEPVAISDDACSHVCSFLGLRDLAVATSVSRQWRLVRGRSWSVNMFHRREKQQWCIDRERLTVGVTDTEITELQQHGFNTVADIIRCDQQYFSSGLVWTCCFLYSTLHVALAASLLDPFNGLELPPMWGCSPDVWAETMISRDSVNKLLSRIVARVDRLSLAEFKFLYGSYGLGEVTKEQSIENRKRRMAWLE